MASATASEELIEKWKRDQLVLKQRLVTVDDVDWYIGHGLSTDDCNNGGTNDSNDDDESSGDAKKKLHLIGGVDISFPKGDDVHACACLVVLSYPELEVVYEDLSMVHLTSPYVPEFLAFREVEFLVQCINRLEENNPDLMPQVIMVDGNGILHPRGFGIASHLGVLINVPTVGVAKNLFHVDGIEKGIEHAEQISKLLKGRGDRFPLVGNSGATWGMALRSSKHSSLTQVCKPIYVSIGHRVSLDLAIKLVDTCCQYRIPEPTRQADIRSREFLRNHYLEELKKCSCEASKLLADDIESKRNTEGKSNFENSLTEDSRKGIENIKLDS